MNTTYPSAARMSNQLRDEYYISKLWNVVSTERWILHIQALECGINWEMNTTYPSSGISYQLRDEYYISKLWNGICSIHLSVDTTFQSVDMKYSSLSWYHIPELGYVVFISQLIRHSSSAWICSIHLSVDTTFQSLCFLSELIIGVLLVIRKLLNQW
jgi:hypothetical protein